MGSSELVAVEATEERYRALTHQPSGSSLDPGTGAGTWPADQFTYRLRNEGAIRLTETEPQIGEADSVVKTAIPMQADGVSRTYDLGGDTASYQGE